MMTSLYMLCSILLHFYLLNSKFCISSLLRGTESWFRSLISSNAMIYFRLSSYKFLSSLPEGRLWCFVFFFFLWVRANVTRAMTRSARGRLARSHVNDVSAAWCCRRCAGAVNVTLLITGGGWRRVGVPAVLWRRVNIMEMVGLRSEAHTVLGKSHSYLAPKVSGSLFPKRSVPISKERIIMAPHCIFTSSLQYSVYFQAGILRLHTSAVMV